MKVYKMNEWDWVCAENEEQAKEHYAKETRFTNDEINSDFVGEVPLWYTTFVRMDDLSIEELKKPQLIVKTFNGETCVKMTFSWVIENEKITSPCIIASTEY